MTRARELAKLGNVNVIAVDSSNNIGIGSTTPDAKVDLGGEFIVGSGASITTAGEAVFAGILTAVGINITGSSVTGVGTQGIDIAARGAVIAGVSTFYGTSSIAADVKVTAGGLDVVGVITSNNKVVATGLDISTAGVDIDGQTDLDELQVAGVSTFSADVDINTTGAVTVGTALTWTNSAGVTTTSGTVHFLDNVYAEFGAGSDLQIYHDASHSYIKDNGTGELKITGSVIAIEGTGETLAKFTDDGAAELYYNNNKKLDTIGTGVTITGGTNASGLSTFQGLSVNGGSLIKEQCTLDANGGSTPWNSNTLFNVSKGNVQHNKTAIAAAGVDLNVVSDVGINTDMQVGEMLTVVAISSVGNASHYIDGLQIDYATQPVNWAGGAAPTAGGASGVDTYSFTIIKIASAQYTVIGNQVLTSA